MRKGRPPVPASIHRLRGNPSKLSAAELEARERAEIRPHPVAPRRPKDLTRFEAVGWDDHAPELDRHGLLTVLDGGAFRHVVTLFAVAMEARERLRPVKADGTPDRRSNRLEILVPDERHGGLRRNPALLAYFQAVRMYLSACREFGMTPSSRVGLRPSGPIGTVPDLDDEDAFFGTPS